MNPPTRLAIFYHATLSGGRNYQNYADPNRNVIQPDYARGIFCDQMGIVVASHLYENVHQFFVGISGSDSDEAFARSRVPPGAEVCRWPPEQEGLLPTTLFMQDWVKTHPDWLCLFFHTKGAAHAGDALTTVWRKCMEKAVIWNWRRCVQDMQAGADSVGAHWLDPKVFGPMVNPEHGWCPFWGGVFYWVKSNFFVTLPRLPDKFTCSTDWFYPEHLIGMGPKRPTVVDYAPHWPGLHSCSR